MTVLRHRPDCIKQRTQRRAPVVICHRACARVTEISACNIIGEQSFHHRAEFGDRSHNDEALSRCQVLEPFGCWGERDNWASGSERLNNLEPTA